MTSPRPVREDLALVYPGDYRPHRPGAPAAPRAPARPSRGSLLDVGCGNGKYLEYARTRGWDGVGIELSALAAEAARAREFEVIVGDALEVAWPATRFDRVRCAHTLEHVHDPEALLRRLREAVRATGRVEVLIPNRRSAPAHLFGRYWQGLELPRHLFHFRISDVRHPAARAGLRLTRIHHEASPSSLLESADRMLAERRRRAPEPLLRDRRGWRRAVRPATLAFAALRMGAVVELELRPLEAETG